MVNTEFLITSLIVVLIPGTGVLFTVSTGLTRGWKASIFAAVGCTAGIIPHLVASVFGLAALLHTSAVAFQILKFLGVLYLAYLAWEMWKDSGRIKLENTYSEKKYRKIAVRAFLINILNPKLSIFFLAFLPQFVPSGTENPIPNMLFLSAAFMLMTLIVFIGYGVLANQIRHYVSQSPKIVQGIQRVFSGLFVAIGFKLATMER
ncbi:MAG: LysE family translocator [Candidatus Thiodiazotropha sp. (ex Lucinoma kastoroae)]|nr:LysE family translocator [Candidatus Thiodiazotropha sp. (ex Lucinoma kastoroae)]